MIVRIILFMALLFLFQGCFSSDNDSETITLEAPIVETAFTPGDTAMQLIVVGKPGSRIFIDGEAYGVIDAEGRSVIVFSSLTGSYELYLQDDNGNQSDSVIFTIEETSTVASASISSSASSLSAANSSVSTSSSAQINSSSPGSSSVQMLASSSIFSAASSSFQSVIISQSSSTAPRPVSSSAVQSSSINSSSSSSSVVSIAASSSSQTESSSSSENATNVPTALQLAPVSLELELGTQSELNVTVTYEDGSRHVPDAGIQWILSNTDILDIDANGTLHALKEGNTTLRAHYQSVVSDMMTVTVYRTVNGYRLPPEPDSVVNNSTLLGIDRNNNGVRDDVERWIYETYKDKHPIHIDIAMQAGRAYKKVLEMPERAKEIHDTVVNAPLYCNWYYWHDADEFNDSILINERIDAAVKGKYFNTKERVGVYKSYDALLSGDSYTLPWSDERKAYCDFNTSKYEE